MNAFLKEDVCVNHWLHDKGYSFFNLYNISYPEFEGLATEEQRIQKLKEKANKKAQMRSRGLSKWHH